MAQSLCSHPSQLGCAATLLYLARHSPNCKNSERSHRVGFLWQATYVVPHPLCLIVSHLSACVVHARIDGLPLFLGCFCRRTVFPSLKGALNPSTFMDLQPLQPARLCPLY